MIQGCVSSGACSRSSDPCILMSAVHDFIYCEKISSQCCDSFHDYVHSCILVSACNRFHGALIQSLAAVPPSLIHGAPNPASPAGRSSPASDALSANPAGCSTAARDALSASLAGCSSAARDALFACPSSSCDCVALPPSAIGAQKPCSQGQARRAWRAARANARLDLGWWASRKTLEKTQQHTVNQKQTVNQEKQI